MFRFVKAWVPGLHTWSSTRPMRHESQLVLTSCRVSKDLRQADHDLQSVLRVRLVCTGCSMGRAKQGLTKETASKACPTQKVDKIDGAYQTLATRILQEAQTRPSGFGGRCGDESVSCLGRCRELETRRWFLSSVACLLGCHCTKYPCVGCGASTARFQHPLGS